MLLSSRVAAALRPHQRTDAPESVDPPLAGPTRLLRGIAWGLLFAVPFWLLVLGGVVLLVRR